MRQEHSPDQQRPRAAIPAARRRSGRLPPDIACLPSFSPAIPVLLSDQANRAATAQLAGLLREAGLVHRRDLACRAEGVGAVFEAAARRWMAQAMPRETRILQPRLGLDALVQDGRLAAVVLEWRSARRIADHVYPVGHMLEALEAAVPGLGQTVLGALEYQWIQPLFGPSRALEHTVHSDWCGEDDETWMLENCCTTPAEREEKRDAIVTRKMFNDTFPTWALLHRTESKLNALAEAELARIAARGGIAGQAAQMLLRLHDARAALELEAGNIAVFPPAPDSLEAGEIEESEEERGVPPEERQVPLEDFTGWGGVLVWNKSDRITERIFDEVFELAMQGHGNDCVGKMKLPPDQPGMLRAALRAMRWHCRASAALDDLLALLTARQ